MGVKRPSDCVRRQSTGWSDTHGDVLEQSEGGRALAAGRADAVGALSHRAALPLAAAVGAGVHHLTLVVLQVDRALHTVPVSRTEEKK